MKQIIRFTKDIREEVEKVKEADQEVYVEMTLGSFTALQAIVKKLYDEAASKKEDAVATLQFYTELMGAVKTCCPAEPDVEQKTEEAMAAEQVL